MNIIVTNGGENVFKEIHISQITRKNCDVYVILSKIRIPVDININVEIDET